MSTEAELRAVLAAYKLVRDASWPDLHPSMATTAPKWAHMDQAQLQAEIAGYLAETAAPGCGVRVFWKVGKDYVFGGCNDHFARDCGMSRAAEVVGLDDFDPRVPWQQQATKYRADDEEVVTSRQPKLHILERQQSKEGLHFVLVGKAPLLLPDGQAIGLLGLYETIDAKQASKIYAQQSGGH